MTNTVYWNESVVCFFQGQGQIRLYQPHHRRNIFLDMKGAALADRLASAGARGVTIDALGNEQVLIRDVTKFNPFENAYLNPAMFDEDAPPLDRSDAISPADAIGLLIEAGMAAREWPIPYSHEKQGFGDRFKGSFYEQVGTECLMNRVHPTKWWTAQKFEPDLRSTRSSAYRYIQDYFLDAYLANNVRGLSIADVGCGTGYYTNRMAKHAKEVVGLDYNPDYIEHARSLWADDKPSAHFAVCDIIDFKAEEPSLIQRQYDRVVMIDTFLFLFHPSYQPVLYENRQVVMQNLRRLVKNDGRVIIMDPNPFWLTAWFGSEDRPFGILENYNTRHFRVVPTLEEITTLFDASGLAIRRILEPRPDKEMSHSQAQAFNFYSEVPPWWVYELQPV